MPNQIKLTAENPDELLNAGAYGAGAVIRLQTASAAAGPFADVSGTGSTPTIALVSGERSYTGYDPGGTSTSWYRSRFENSGATRTSDWSAAFQVVASSDALCSVYDVKQRLGINDADTSQDENITDWIGQASAWMVHRVRRPLTPDPPSGDRTYTFDGRGGAVLFVRRGVRSITTLEVATETGGAYSIVAASDYFLRPSAAEREPGWPATQLWLSDVGDTPCFYPGFDTIRITGAFGFAAVPKELEAIALTLVVAAARELGNSGGETVTVNVDGDRVYERALSLKDWRTLEHYSLGPRIA